ncbi:sulfate transporter [Janthinobacterium lividum]|uniref:Sulfate transporter n=1 Tax=Janthinobacterium lividum TaxID=29581 RepID=A0A1E8PJG2_9BURK|nr:sulfate transporter [Janthinobacterium lividum]
MKLQTQTTPDGYKLDAQSRLVPISMIRPIDLTRDALVQEIVTKAATLAEQIATLKAGFFSDIAAFVSLSAEQYGVKIGGEKGNVSLVSYDGRYKVQRAIQETLIFDERLQAAKALIDACLQRWSQGAQPEIKVLINDAFQVDKSGNINTGRVLGLRRLDINDDEWMRAMKAIGEALQVSGSRSYIRVYERIGETEKYQPISLDMAGV